MSLRGKEVRPLIDADMHERLAIMAEYRDLQLNEFASRLLESAICYEWREVSVLIERSDRLGKRWKLLESGGPRTSAEALRQRAEREID